MNLLRAMGLNRQEGRYRPWVPALIASALFATALCRAEDPHFRIGLAFSRIEGDGWENLRGPSIYLGGEVRSFQLLGDIGFLQENWPIRNAGSSEDPIRPDERGGLVFLSLKARFGRTLGLGFWPYAGAGATYGKTFEGDVRNDSKILVPVLEVGVTNSFLKIVDFGVGYRYDLFFLHRVAIESGFRFGLQ